MSQCTVCPKADQSVQRFSGGDARYCYIEDLHISFAGAYL